MKNMNWDDTKKEQQRIEQEIIEQNGTLDRSVRENDHLDDFLTFAIRRKYIRVTRTNPADFS